MPRVQSALIAPSLWYAPLARALGLASGAWLLYARGCAAYSTQAAQQLGTSGSVRLGGGQRRRCRGVHLTLADA